jgi:monoamine oxidase
VSPADWLSHAIVSGVQPATGATTSMLAASVDLQRLEPVQLVTGRMADYVEQLAESLDIAVSSVVVRVAYNDERVSLRLDTGESVAADRAIIALPLGVLKTDTVRFSPALPLLHQRAISMIGVGRLDTVWLQFDEAFWRSTEHGMAYANLLTLVGTTPDVGVWFDVGSATGDAPVLLGLIAAGAAQRLEALDDDAFREAVLAGLVPYSSDSNAEGADDEVD